MSYLEFMEVLEAAASKYDAPRFDLLEDEELMSTFDEDFNSIFDGRE